jgi:hypothetical protein
VIGWWFSPGTPVSSTNKIDRHDILTEIFLKVALNTINQTKPPRHFLLKACSKPGSVMYLCVMSIELHLSTILLFD